MFRPGPVQEYTNAATYASDHSMCYDVEYDGSDMIDMKCSEGEKKGGHLLQRHFSSHKKTLSKSPIHHKIVKEGFRSFDGENLEA